MKAVLLILAAVACSAKDELHDVTSLQPPVNLDANLRRALLKALTELENEDSTKSRTVRDMIFEKASAAAVSFTANSLSTEKPSPTTEETTEKPIIVIQRSRGVQSRPITTFESARLDPVRDAENILASASSSFRSSDRLPQRNRYDKSVNSKSSVSSNSFGNFVTVTSRPRLATIETTTPITTTTSTEESEARVEDVQFFTAPLVAAFTVHQDERGLPQSVVPIYQQAGNNVVRKQLDDELKFKQELARQQEQVKQQELLQKHALLKNQEILKQRELKQQELIKQQEFLRKQELSKQAELQKQQNAINQNQEKIKERQIYEEQLLTQIRLQEKQRRLEQEIRLLRQKQEQQDLLIRQQQVLHEKQLRDQRQKILDEQVRLHNQQQFLRVVTPIAIPLVKPTVIPTNFNGIPKTKGTILSFQPSITINPGALPLNAQILPIKNAINFRQPFMEATTIIPLIPITQPLSQQQPPLVTRIPNYNFVQNIEQTLPPPQSNRIFRQETGTGNFFNTNSNNIGLIPPPSNFNSFPQFNQQSNRFFRSNLEGTQISPNNFKTVQPPVITNHLNNLLYNSGIYHDRQYEDLNIVSKVLSLNHLGSDNRFGSSNVNLRKFPSPR